MKLLALGVDHRKAPAPVREALAFEGARLDQGLDALKSGFPEGEFVVLSTCNRVEVYAAGVDGAIPTTGALIEWLAQFHGRLADEFAAHLVDHHDGEAVAHLFKVAASLESLVLGEGQILGQVRDAYKAAVARKSVGPILHAVFPHALRVGKLVRERTGMDKGKLSVASVAVDVARDVFDTFGDKTVLVIGAGKMGDLTLQHLSTLRPGSILVTNRNPERAEAVARRWGGKAVPFDRLESALVEADVVVSTTAADRPIVDLALYSRVQKARKNRLALILDIAIPRDFDPKIGDLEQVMLYNVDDLQAQADRNRKNRQKGVDPALAIIEQETATCLAALRHRTHAGAVLRQLGDYADAARLREFDALVARQPDLTQAQRDDIAHALMRLQNQFLHHPRAALRTAATAEPTEHPHPLLHAVKALFGLADG
ncbi:glutamyl-tRNA reductase [Tundrisphaera lichenicola]|uniref:glutamyl-tRNA reductase n=1 Tax=Tundrisphaera lichenicola TaxID=2029860 RepID=UPI003EBEDDB7